MGHGFPCHPQCGTLQPCDKASESLLAGCHVTHCRSSLMYAYGSPGHRPPRTLRRRDALPAPASYSQAGVKSSGQALKGKCFSDVWPEIALPFPKLITSCLDSQFYFRNKCLLVPFTFNTTQGQPFTSVPQKGQHLATGALDGKPQGSEVDQQALTSAWGQEVNKWPVQSRASSSLEPVYTRVHAKAHSSQITIMVITCIYKVLSQMGFFQEGPQTREKCPSQTKHALSASPWQGVSCQATEAGTALEINPVTGPMSKHSGAHSQQQVDPEPGSDPGPAISPPGSLVSETSSITCRASAK